MRDGTSVPPSSGGVNGKTAVAMRRSSVSRATFAVVWKRIFPKLAEVYPTFRQDGFLCAWAWESARLAGYLHVPLGSGPEFVILGRHNQCDIRLPSDESVSLRHAVLAGGRVDGELRVRLVDLQSGTGVITEDGTECESLVADGALFVQVGGYHLFVLPTGHLCPMPWSPNATPEEAWAAIPERVYLDRRAPNREENADRVPEGTSGGRRSITQVVPAPVALRRRRFGPGDRGPKVGTLALGARGVVETYSVHDGDLERGILVGRYERCAFGAEDQRLSRVHLLVMRHADATWAIDTASTNGTSAAGGAIRHHRLAGVTDLMLGNAVGLRWADGDTPIYDPR